MVDTLNMKLDAAEAGNMDLLAEIPARLDNLSQHIFGGDFMLVTGYVGSLKVSVSPYCVKVKDSSFYKWCLGDNFQTMGRGDIKQGLERLSDTLHLSMSKAEITRLDIAKNFIVKQPVEIYLNHLGALQHKGRYQQKSSLYYSGGNTQITFYDKIKEQRRAGENIPGLYKGRNVLRFEVRFLHRLPEVLNVPKVTGGLLYDEPFYIAMVKRWNSVYKHIHKINDVDLNWDMIKNKRNFYKAGSLVLSEQ